MDTCEGRVADLLRGKRRPGVVVTASTASVRAATVLMNHHGIGAVAVVEGRRLVGIFTERDVLRRVVAASLPPDDTAVGDVMTADVVCCGPDARVADVAEAMRDRRIRHVPVVDGDDVVGLISIGDINAARFASCEVALTQMHDYVYGRG